jgi:DNA-binding CsgD family transcriptional regulator
LSKRELDIITYIKQGHTSKEIAEQLFISQFTVDTHRKNILKKLQLPSVKALIAFAHENRI